MVKATVKAEWALPPLFRIRQYDRQHRPPPPLFLIITSVASLGTCAGGGELLGILYFSSKNQLGIKKIGIAVTMGFKKCLQIWKRR
jgi:hypothetical protein